MKRYFGFAGAVILMMGFFATYAQSAEKPWIPARDIEFVVPSAPGGGSDINARVIADIARTNKFSPMPIMVVNRPGGAGAVAFSLVNAKKGDKETLMVLHSGQAVGSYVNNWAVKTEHLTYIATVALDQLTLGVRKEGNYPDFKSMLAAVKDKPGSIRIGGSQRGNTDHLAFELINKYTNSKFRYVMFNSSGEVMSALLGGHIEAGIFNPGECIGQVTAGIVVPVATFAEKRLPGVFKNTPTFAELGYSAIQADEVRAIAGPPNMDPAAVRFYEELLKKITETEEWQKNYIERHLLTNHFLNASATKTFFDKLIQEHIAVFKEIGFIK